MGCGLCLLSSSQPSRLLLPRQLLQHLVQPLVLGHILSSSLW